MKLGSIAFDSGQRSCSLSAMLVNASNSSGNKQQLLNVRRLSELNTWSMSSQRSRTAQLMSASRKPLMMPPQISRTSTRNMGVMNMYDVPDGEGTETLGGGNATSSLTSEISIPSKSNIFMMTEAKRNLPATHVSRLVLGFLINSTVLSFQVSVATVARQETKLG